MKAVEWIATAVVGTSAFCFVLTIIGLFVGLPIMWLWNWLMPGLFDLPTIGFWQAIGLYLLSGLLFRSVSTNKGAAAGS